MNYYTIITKKIYNNNIMAFNLIHKNVFGVSIVLLLIVLLSQAKTFNFLIDTSLGRFCLIIFILAASYIHNILGVVMVLFIIIMINQNTVDYNNLSNWNQLDPWNSFDNYNYIEGFTGPSGETVDASNIANKIASITTPITNVAATTTANTANTATAIKNNIANKVATVTGTSPATTTSGFRGIEGFNIIDTEGSILKGKRSSEMPVFSNSRIQNNNIEPTNSSIFINNYAKVF